jgi:hypothetical protein
MMNGTIKAELTQIDRAIKEYEGKIKQLQRARVHLERAADVLEDKRLVKADGWVEKPKKALKRKTPYRSLEQIMDDSAAKKAARKAKAKKAEPMIEYLIPTMPKRDDDPVHTQAQTEEMASAVSGTGLTWGELRARRFQLGARRFRLHGDGAHFPKGVVRNSLVDLYCGDTLYERVRAGSTAWGKVTAWRFSDAAQDRDASWVKNRVKELIAEGKVKPNAEIPKPDTEMVVMTKRADGSMGPVGASIRKSTKPYKEGSRAQLITDAAYNRIRQYRRPVRTSELMEILSKQKGLGEQITVMPRPLEQIHGLLNHDPRFKNLGMRKGGWTVVE